MKPLPVNVQKAILRACIRNWQRVVASRASRFLFRRPVAFSNRPISEIISWLTSTNGDWKSVREELRRKDYAPRLFDWADKVKGGAL